ncbi:sensor domain-containing diguanylate cyclase [Paenibacillus alkaliterrae]|uniref:sensor domain-containing diguanylate cyclase n=1 Tax=Paenibacillus alkaliterrae TaxID=320909 RepID=UPI001F314E18|nr:sensor domain-containing diguanylate cyclase [Paenibacillus alkaliterrae]MCF2936879.1 sensor domain-containing diguanylate cyclase [Paenibacillus alkaliterrae]
MDDRIKSNFPPQIKSTMVEVSSELQSIWFHSEDFRDADEPMLPSLLEDSFEQWSTEAAGLALFQNGQFALFNKEGHEIIATVPLLALMGEGRDAAAAAAVADALTSRQTAAFEAAAHFAVAVPQRRRVDGAVFSVIAYVTTTDFVQIRSEVEACALHFRSCFYRKFEEIYIKDMLLQQQRAEKEAIRKESLFHTAKQLYNQIDVASVLSELLRSLEQLYPHSEVHLYLSQDHLNGDPRVKPLVFKNAEHDIVAKAFLNGSSVTEHDRDGTIRLAVPMTGKQAAYGVLCMTIGPGKWDEADLPAFLLLADTSGSAFENAKLYEQSNLLINELRLINELTKRLNQSLRLKEIFQFATSELLTIFEANYCCVLQLNKESNQFVVMSSNIPALASEQFSPEYGFCGMVYRTKEPMIISDYWHTRVVTSKLMDNTGSRSLIAAPIMVDGEVVGVILVAHKAPNFFSYENYKLLQVMSTHIGLALTNASLHAEVRRMVITDNLTGLHARHYLDEQIQNRQRKDPFGSLILVDIDHFKKVNDTYGHQVGDRILIQVSGIISAAIRQGDIAARWGGEELAVYLPGIRAEQAYRIAERIRMHVEGQTDPVVTVSCGVSEWTYEDDKISVESLFYRADMALYEAKGNGRNCIFIG